MNEQPRYRLGATDRLKSRKRIEQLFREGKAFSHFPFRVVYRKEAGNDSSRLQAGFTVSTRFFKKSVDRNRIRRQMREAYRLQKHSLDEDLGSTGQRLLVFFIYTGNDMPEYKDIVAKTGTALKRLQKIIHETGSPA